MPPYIAFDIEIAKVLPPRAQDWDTYRPLGISCAATLTDEGQLTLWHGHTATGEIAERMSQVELLELVEHLEMAVDNDMTILTWNGLRFDFDILAEESGLYARCKKLAINHVDMMFHFFCERGYALGLDKAAKGMGLQGKTEGMRGDLAPRFWAEGKRQEVLDYVVQDVRTTLNLAQIVERDHQLRWRSSRGNRQILSLARGWLTVREALTLPEPDITWMRDPWPRTKFSGWLEGEPPT